jgi:hypothetical protein
LNFTDSIDLVEKFTAVPPQYDVWYGNPYLTFDGELVGAG